MSNKRNIAYWALTILLTLFFLLAGTQKWAEAFHIAANYDAMGMSMSIMKMIGAIEIILAIGLLFKKNIPSRCFGVGNRHNLHARFFLHLPNMGCSNRSNRYPAAHTRTYLYSSEELTAL